MHPRDAAERRIHDGDPVRVHNRRGELHLTARVNGSVQPGVVAARLNWAKFHPESQNVNVLTSEKLTDLGNSATFYSVLAEVELAKSMADRRSS
jgi:anaerobic selenocysteine-containing dehydrogenase